MSEPIIDLEFMQKAKEIADALPYEDKLVNPKSWRDWNKRNKEKVKEYLKKYNDTKKGKIASKRRMATRHRRIRDQCSDLSHEDLENIKNFYTYCPVGYEVDHIIPISKGGKHILSNLQYLTPKENRQKSAKLDWKCGT